MNKPIVALMYDFDKTLSPKNMQEYGFMDGLGISAEEFWKMCAETAKKHNMDAILAYMYVMLQAGEGKLLLRREDFRALGSSVKLFPGVRGWFDRINAYCEEKGLLCEHYIISSGLREIIEGTEIAGEFKEIYAAEFLYGPNRLAKWPAMAVNYTSKTQFLYRINKGVLDVTEDGTLNKYVPDEDRRVPFSNMIYFGDGETAVPCQKLTPVHGGHSIVVYQDSTEVAERLLREGRADFAFRADYRSGKALDRAVHAIIDQIAAKEALQAIRARQRVKLQG
ncbi:MAG: haloacid dehalogenase-like hydrolase [Mogibacterium sp.]|nr:haloacid dehalogenase-like hydrolase [Mogibacterium sp.]